MFKLKYLHGWLNLILNIQLNNTSTARCDVSKEAPEAPKAINSFANFLSYLPYLLIGLYFWRQHTFLLHKTWKSRCNWAGLHPSENLYAFV